MAIKLMCKLLYVLEINLFEMLLLVMYIFVSVNLKPSDPPYAHRGGGTPRKIGWGHFRQPLPYLRANSILLPY